MAAGLYRRSLGLLAAAIAATALAFAVAGGALVDRAYGEAAFYSLGGAAGALAGALPTAEGPEAEAFCAAAAAGSGFRVTIVEPDGSVAADSSAPAASMPNHAARPEVREALDGRIGTARRRSATLGTELVYAAAPVFRDGGGRRAVAAVLRIAAEVPSLESRMRPARWAIFIAAAAFAAVAAAAAAAFSRSLALPMVRLAERARAYASGERDTAGSPAGAGRGVAELIALGEALDTMAAELERRVREARASGAELGAVLDSISEALVALDPNLRVKLMNPSARALFGLARAEDAAGRDFLSVARSTELFALAQRCLESGAPLRSELVLDLSRERWFRVLAAPFCPSCPADAARAVPPPAEARQQGPPDRGLVLVLEDITELRRLERVRRDFVANVSHELRTPIQIVKGFAESIRDLLSGVAESPAREGRADESLPLALRHVGIIERNAARMESLISDLLALASLEREGSGALEVEEVQVARLLEEAVEAVAPKAKARSMALRVECPEGLAARLNPGLVVQALVNLVDNAVKYSPAGSEIALRARREGADLVLEVSDRGIGIPAKDLGRLFERFYRVDKARSRELGGTGLGLAIVKHIALAHGGRAEVESWEGEGSTFRLRIPSDQGTPGEGSRT